MWVAEKEDALATLIWHGPGASHLTGDLDVGIVCEEVLGSVVFNGDEDACGAGAGTPEPVIVMAAYGGGEVRREEVDGARLAVVVAQDDGLGLLGR